MTDRIYALLQGSALTALALALMAIQFTVAGSFVVVTWLAPLVFACAAVRLPFRVLRIVVLGSTGGCLLLFGIVTSIWVLFYALYGIIVGATYRARWPLLLRVTLSAASFWVLFQGVIVLLIALVGTVSADLVSTLYDLVQLQYWLFAGPLAVVALANSIVCTRLTRKVFQQLSMTM